VEVARGLNIVDFEPRGLIPLCGLQRHRSGARDAQFGVVCTYRIMELQSHCKQSLMAKRPVSEA
jgi:hypothetical protein